MLSREMVNRRFRTRDANNYLFPPFSLVATWSRLDLAKHTHRNSEPTKEFNTKGVLAGMKNVTPPHNACRPVPSQAKPVPASTIASDATLIGSVVYSSPGGT